MFWLLGGFGASVLCASRLGLLWGAQCAHRISLLLGLVHFVIKFDFIFLIGVLLHGPGLGRVGAGDDVVQELVLLLGRTEASIRWGGGGAPGVLQPMSRSGNLLGSPGKPGSQTPGLPRFHGWHIRNGFLSPQFERVDAGALRTVPGSSPDGPRCLTPTPLRMAPLGPGCRVLCLISWLAPTHGLASGSPPSGSPP